MTTVLLTGARAPATLDLARRFADAGATVVVADSQPALTASSKAVTAAYRVPPPRFRPAEFAQAVVGIARRHDVDLIVPTCEETFWLAASAAAAVGAGAGPPGSDTAHALAGLLFAPHIQVLRRLHDKAEFATLLAELDLPHPRTDVIESAIDWRHRAQARDRMISRDHPGDPPRLVLKPAFSRFGTRTRILDPHQPLPPLSRVTHDERWVLQEHIDGDEFCTYAVAIEGRLTAFVAYRPVWRAGRRGHTGAGVAFVRLESTDAPVREARRIAERLAAALTLTGQFGLDLMQRRDPRGTAPRPDDSASSDPSASASASADPGAGEGAGAGPGVDVGTARVVVLECNPRATSGIHLFAPSDGLAAAFLPTPIHPTTIRPGGGRSASTRPADPLNPAVTRVPMPSAAPVQASRPSARLGIPHLMYAPIGFGGAAGSATHLRQLRYPDALCPAGDRIPVAALLRSLAVQVRESRRSRVGLLAASTRDLEWNGDTDTDTGSDTDPSAGTTTAPWAPAFTAAIADAGGTAAAIDNVSVELRTVRVGAHELPLTITRQPPRGAAPQSYVVSPFTHYVHYAREELGELGSAGARGAGRVLLAGLAGVLRRAAIDDVVMVGNGLVSTNLLPDVGEREVAEATARLRHAHPERAIAWRSVHGRGLLLPETLRRCGYRLLPSRSVFFVPTRGAEWQRLRDVRRDRRLFELSDYEALPAAIDESSGMSSRATRERIVELYRMLYLDKYSRLNPAYTADFVGAAQRSGFLRFTLLVDRSGRIDGVMGTRTAHGFLAAPVFGYDTTLPPQAGLYRMLSWLVARQAHDEGAELHASSGVADFKRHRGGEAELEYTAVFVQHLPWRRRAAWRALEFALERVAVPLIGRAGL